MEVTQRVATAPLAERELSTQARSAQVRRRAMRLRQPPAPGQVPRAAPIGFITVIGYLRQARGQREEGQPEQDALPAGALHRAGPRRAARLGLAENPYQRPALGPVRGRPCAVRAPQRENILAFIGAARGPRTRPLSGPPTRWISREQEYDHEWEWEQE